MENNILKILHLSDIHLCENIQSQLKHINTHESFKAVLNHILEKNLQANLILLSGDLSQDGSILSYHHLANQIQELNLPAYFVPGNHDDLIHLAQVFPNKTIDTHKHLTFKNWHIILLNSKLVDQEGGFLDKAQLQFLKSALDSHPEKYALIMLHHQPIPIGSEWIDQIGLSNSNALWEILSHYPLVKIILFGHVHQASHTIKNNINCFSSPSTCFQFKPHEKDFTIDDLAPGFRWINLFADGSFETDVERINQC